MILSEWDGTSTFHIHLHIIMKRKFGVGLKRKSFFSILALVLDLLFADRVLRKEECMPNVQSSLTKVATFLVSRPGRGENILAQVFSLREKY